MKPEEIEMLTETDLDKAIEKFVYEYNDETCTVIQSYVSFCELRNRVALLFMREKGLYDEFMAYFDKYLSENELNNVHLAKEEQVA